MPDIKRVFQYHGAEHKTINAYEAGSELVAALQQFVKANIAPYKYPRAIEFVDALPRTETGKLQRFALRKMA